MPEVKVSKNIKYPEDPQFGEHVTENSYENKMEEFISKASNQPKSAEQKDIQIKSEKLGSFSELKKDLLNVEGLSFDISDVDAMRIYQQIITIMADPLTVAALFKDLDKALGDLMQKNGIAFSTNDDPQFLITGKGNYVPGPPPEDYHPKKKERLLDELLLAREVKNQINKEGNVPKFVGFVDSNKADPLVSSGYIFTEDKQISRILLHGSMTHRLMFDALCHAANTGELNLQYGDGKVLTPQQLLELLVLGKYYQKITDRVLNKNPFSLWTLTLDTVVDQRNTLEPDQYNFSCRSPFVLNSLFLCFGKEVGLPNLQHYLLDSHWKAAYEMVNRVKQSKTAENIPNGQIYTYCMEALSTTKGQAGQVDMKLPFTLDEKKSRANPSYEAFDNTSPPGIVKKKSGLKSSAGEYASWDEFFASKNEKHATKFPAEQKIEVKAELEKISYPEPAAKDSLEPAAAFEPETELQTTFDSEKTESVTDIWRNINEYIKQDRPALLEAELKKFKPTILTLIVGLYVLAAMHRAEDCLRVLVNAQLDINAIDEIDHKTAWMKAKENRDEVGMRMLEKAGARSAKHTDKMWDGIRKNNAELFREGIKDLEKEVQVMPFLMTSYYDLVIFNRADECLRVLIESKWDINGVNRDLKTPLMLANDRSDYEGMLMLIKAGAKISPPASPSTFLITPGWKPFSSIATTIIKNLQTGISTSDDRQLTQDMEHYLTEKSNPQQLIIILLDYLVRNNSFTLSSTMKNQIKYTLDSLLQEQEKELSWKPMPKQ